MSILTWIEDKKRQKVLNAPKNVASASDSSKGLWTRCDKCGVILYIKHLKENQRVCFGCSYHLQMMSQERIENLLDKVPLAYSLQSKTFSRKHSNGDYKNDEAEATPNEPSFAASQKSSKSAKANASTKLRENMVSTWRPLDETVSPCDPLRFFDQKTYTDRLRDAQERTGLQDAIQTGTGMIDGIPIALAVMDFSFMGGSMGSVVGEKITRLIEYATQEGLTLIIVSASGGARMQEGVFSLMQMAKISSALQIYQSCAKLLYISILTSPTTGGVTASFAMLGDIIFAEPKALIAFAGRRVIEQTLSEDLPEDFQTSEYMLHHGLVDLIVPRRFLRQALSESIRLYQNAPFKKVGQIPFGVQNPITFLTEEKVRRQLTKNRSVRLPKQGTKSIDVEESVLAELSVFSSKLASSAPAPPIEKSKALDACCEPLVFAMQSKALQNHARRMPMPMQIFDLQGQGQEQGQADPVTRSMSDQTTQPYREILSSFRMMLNLFSPITDQYSDAELRSNQDIFRKIGTNPESSVGASQNRKVSHVQGCEITKKISVFRPEKGLIPLPWLKKSNSALQLVYHQRLTKDFHIGKEYIRSLKSQLGYLLLQSNNKNIQKACPGVGVAMPSPLPEGHGHGQGEKIEDLYTFGDAHADRRFACASPKVYKSSICKPSSPCKCKTSFCKRFCTCMSMGTIAIKKKEPNALNPFFRASVQMSPRVCKAFTTRKKIIKKGVLTSQHKAPAPHLNGCKKMTPFEFANRGFASTSKSSAYAQSVVQSSDNRKSVSRKPSASFCKKNWTHRFATHQTFLGLLKPFYRLSLQNTRQSTDIFKSRANKSYMLKRKSIGSNDNNHFPLSFESFRNSDFFSFHPNIRLVSKKEQFPKKNSALVNRSTIGLQFLENTNLIINPLQVNFRLVPDALTPKVYLPLPSCKSSICSPCPKGMATPTQSVGLRNGNIPFISQTLAKRLFAKRDYNASLSSICKPSLKVINDGNLMHVHKKSKREAPFINISYKGNKIPLLNRAIELAATESVEWRAFYIDKLVAEKVMRVSCKTICRSEKLVSM